MDNCLLTLENKKKDPGFRAKSLRKLLRISYSEHKTSDWVRDETDFLVDPQVPLPANVKVRKLAWFWHVTRHDSFSISKAIHHLGQFEGWATPWSAEEMLDGQSKSGLPCPCQNCLQWPSALKTGRGSLLNRLSCPPDDPVGQGTKLISLWQRQRHVK